MSQKAARLRRVPPSRTAVRASLSRLDARQERYVARPGSLATVLWGA